MMRSEVMPAAELSDADLVAESLEGNRDAFGQIVERYQTLIASLAYCATGDVSQSEDLAQETFVSAWKQLSELREPAKLRPWLCSITRFLAGKEFRRQGREPIHEAQPLDELEEWESPDPLPPEHAISQEELSLLWRSLERIPPAYREPLVLFYREHQSIEAVAAGLGLSEDAVKQRLSRGRKFLQEQFMAFVAGALDQTRPGKTFALGVLAALPLVGATATGATVGTTLAKHGSVAAKTTASGGIVYALGYLLMDMVYWVAAALPLGGYIGYKMGGDSQDSERARRSVATFWGIMGISMFCYFCLPVPAVYLLEKVVHLPEAKGIAIAYFYVNVGLPVFIYGVVPLSVVIWIWQRRRRAVPGAAIGGPISCRSSKYVTIWVALAMTVALLILGVSSWAYSVTSKAGVLGHQTTTRYVSTSEVQELIANPKGRAIRFELFQRASGARRLLGYVGTNDTGYYVLAPAESSTLALLAEKGISYETKIEGRNIRRQPPDLVWWSQRLLNPLCCFILVAGAVTLLRGRHYRQSQPRAIIGPTNEHRVDRSFAALAACGMVALAVGVGLTTDWKVHRIAAGRVADVIARHPKARFEVFEYRNGARKLWISDHHTPDFIAPASESTLGLLKRQGVAYQTYVAEEGVGTTHRPGRSQSIALLWILALAAAAGGLLWWTVKNRPASPSPG
jgi:RNA polymerase sigma factor (sigma-70 family)